MRLFTVPKGRPNLSAISRYLNPDTCIEKGTFEVPLFAEVVLAVYLMVLQTVDVCHVVAAYQMVGLIVHTFAPHISVDGIAGVEEGISDVIGSAETVAEITQCGNL